MVIFHSYVSLPEGNMKQPYGNPNGDSLMVAINEFVNYSNVYF